MQQQNIVIINYHHLATDDTQHPELEYFLDFCCQNTLIQNTELACNKEQSTAAWCGGKNRT